MSVKDEGTAMLKKVIEDGIKATAIPLPPSSKSVCPDHIHFHTTLEGVRMGVNALLICKQARIGSNGDIPNESENGSEPRTKEFAMGFGKATFFKLKNYTAKEVGNILWRTIVTIWFILILWNTLDGKNQVRKLLGEPVGKTNHVRVGIVP